MDRNDGSPRHSEDATNSNGRWKRGKHRRRSKFNLFAERKKNFTSRKVTNNRPTSRRHRYQTESYAKNNGMHGMASTKTKALSGPRRDCQRRSTEERPSAVRTENNASRVEHMPENECIPPNHTINGFDFNNPTTSEAYQRFEQSWVLQSDHFGGDSFHKRGSVSRVVCRIALKLFPQRHIRPSVKGKVINRGGNGAERSKARRIARHTYGDDEAV